MFAFFKNYLKAFLLITAVMIGYRIVVVPFVEPPPRAQSANAAPHLALPNEHWWHVFFPSGSWQTQSPKIIHTHQGILLANEFEPIDDKTWKLKPLTMILPQSEEGRAALANKSTKSVADQEMWIISAQQGATIHFEEPLNLNTGNTASIERGELSGVIRVTRQNAQQREDRPWNLTTYDLAINRTQLATQRQVRIEWDGSIVEGSDLLIKLRGDLLGGTGSHSDTWGPMDQLELYHVDTVKIALQPGGLWAGMEPSETQLDDIAPDWRQLPATLFAECGGRFSFDFNNSTGMLQNGVQVTHQLGSLPGDVFACELLSFEMIPPEQATDTTASAKPVEMGGFRIARLDAFGADPIGEFIGEKWVDLDAPSMAVQSKSKSMKIDLRKNRIAFSGQINRPGAVRGLATVIYQGHQFVAPKIEYQAPPREPAAPASHLGWLYASGPGRLTMAEESSDEGSADIAGASVFWNRSLKMTPARELPDAQWLELLGAAKIQSPAQGSLESERIEIWLGADQGPSSSSTYRSALAPKRVYAEAEARFQTPRINAIVGSLDLSFRQIAASAPADSTNDSELALTDSEGNPMYQWIGPPSNGDSNAAVGPAGGDPRGPGMTASGQALGSPEARETKPARIEIRGSQMTGSIARESETTWIDSLHIAGPVTLAQPAGAQQGQLPWQISGADLLMATDLEGQADVQIDGAPARLNVAEGFLEGPSIRFNQAHNLILMDHPGQFTIPTSLLNKPDATSAMSPTDTASNRRPSVEWFKPPHCRWQGRMMFDGSVVHIERDVEFDAAFRTSVDQNWFTAGTSDAMEIVLKTPIDFSSISTSDQPSRNAGPSQQVEIDRVILRNRVQILASQLDRFGEKQSRNAIHVPVMTFFFDDRRLIANGPGTLHSRFLSAEGLGQRAAQPPRTESDDDELQGAYLTFRDSMLALTDQEEVTFDGKVELLTGPVDDWDDEVDPAAQQSLGANQMLLNSDQFKVFDTGQLNRHNSSLAGPSGRSDTWEFKAMGNVAFNGVMDRGEFQGRGHQLTYAKSKSQLTLRGAGPTNQAYIRVVPKSKTRGVFEANLQSAVVDPETMEVKEFLLGQSGARFQANDANRPRSPGDSNLSAPGLRQTPEARRVGDFYRRP